MNIIEQIEAVALRYHPDHQIAVAGFLARHGKSAVHDLFRINPALGLMLVYAHTFVWLGREPWQVVEGWVRERQRDILRKLWNMPTLTESVARIVKRIDASRTSIGECETLRNMIACHDHRTKTLQHLLTINGSVIQILQDKDWNKSVTYSLLQDASVFEFDTDVVHKLKVLKQILSLSPEHMPRFRYLWELGQRYEEETTLYAMIDWNPEYDKIEFPDPPIRIPPETQGNHLRIQYVCTACDLYDAAIGFRCCVMDMLEAIREGNMAVYRVYKPEPVLLALEPKGDGSWVITQCYGPRNRPVNKRTFWLIAAYLNRRQQVAVDLLNQLRWRHQN